MRSTLFFWVASRSSRGEEGRFGEFLKGEGEGTRGELVGDDEKAGEGVGEREMGTDRSLGVE